MIARARAKAAGRDSRVDFLVAQSQALPFTSSTFDIVMYITVLTFFSDADIAVRGMARVLRPGGAAIDRRPGERWRLWAARRRILGWFGTNQWRTARFRTATELVALIEHAGLSVGSIQGSIFFPPWTALARLMAPLDAYLGEVTTLGAAFVAIQATKRGGVKTD
jgi:2-polyprenyl-3-methyl-5-hydroxy-6-metoxy-1,4-benzoquinol methylase